MSIIRLILPMIPDCQTEISENINEKHCVVVIKNYITMQCIQLSCSRDTQTTMRL